MLGVAQRLWWPLEHVAVLCVELGPGPDWCKLPGPGLLLAGNWAPLTGTATSHRATACYCHARGEVAHCTIIIICMVWRGFVCCFRLGEVDIGTAAAGS